MKTQLTLMIALSLPAFAGTGKEVVPEPVIEPTLLEWFAGGSVGYLTELEEPMYHLHLGQDTGHQLGGWDFAWFVEIGYTDKDESYTRQQSTPSMLMQAPNNGTFDLDDLEAFLSANAGMGQGSWGYDLSILPITINGKLERNLTGNLNAYAGAGVGVAQIDLDINTGGTSVSDDDWVFAAQAFAGLNYNFSKSCELYGGARWMYFDDADIGPYTLELEDDFLFEIGYRYNF